MLSINLFRKPKDYSSVTTEGLTNIFKSFFLSGKLKKQYNYNH